MDDATPLIMPAVAETTREGVLIAWLRRPGDRVEMGEAIAEIEIDKATEILEAPASGLLDAHVAEGDTVAVGATIARIRPPAAEGDDPERATPGDGGDEPVAGTSSADPADWPAVHRVDISILASPLARRLAAIHEVDLATISGSGPGGMILRGDVGQAAGLSGRAAGAPTPPPGPVRPPPPLTGEAESRPLSRIQRIVAERMSASHATMPTFSLSVDADVGSALELRRRLAAELDGAPPSITDMLIRALALALRAEPRANASYRDGAAIIHGRVNVGMAVAVDDGLLVPVIVDADRLSLSQVGRRSRELIEQARSGALPASALEGGTITLTNVGSLGVDAAVPAVNAPQVAILAAGTARNVPVVRDGLVEPGWLMNLTLSADHRVLNGADGARLLAHVGASLERPLRLLSGA